MARDEKDRLGDKLRDVERAREDQFFAERDRKLVEEIRRSSAGEVKPAAHMLCPKCGETFRKRKLRKVSVEECPGCHGMWLDQGGLKEIARQETEGQDGWIARWLRTEFPHD
jgi:predicted Zn-ribbon and HTH transcriptional regulator